MPVLCASREAVVPVPVFFGRAASFPMLLPRLVLLPVVCFVLPFSLE
nr:MAG TPA: hypothetical protein [Caudoviricetes sp.]